MNRKNVKQDKSQTTQSQTATNDESVLSKDGFDPDSKPESRETVESEESNPKDSKSKEYEVTEESEETLFIDSKSKEYEESEDSKSEDFQEGECHGQADHVKK
jgi:hypothetical protein